jgi:hypothetical protein
VPLEGGYINVDELGRRPGLGVELDMELVGSRPFQPLAAGRFANADGSTNMY